MTTVQKIGVLLLVIFAIGYYNNQTVSQERSADAVAWYRGGTLHEATILQWKTATAQNKLATAADWTTGVIGQSEFERLGLDGVKEMAQSLVDCIDGSIEGLRDSDSSSAREVGGLCIWSMHWKQ